MTAVPRAAITAAAIVLHDEHCDDGDTPTCGRWKSGDRYPTPQGVTHVSFYEERARLALEAAAPLIAAAERERIAAVITPARLRLIADWFDADDEFKSTMFPRTWPSRADDVQRDLRAWADILGGDSR